MAVTLRVLQLCRVGVLGLEALLPKCYLLAAERGEGTHMRSHS